MLAFINWRVDPIAFTVGPITYQWYGILFMTALVSSYWIVQWMFKHEQINDKNLFNAAILLSAGGVIGARLGEVFFYNWDYFSNHLSEIPQIWKGGLASHGGGVGVLIAGWMAARYILRMSYLFLLDRLAVASSVGLGLIRVGNLMNHEIVGEPTNVPWAFVFHQGIDLIPRHPTQLYEALFFVLIFSIMFFIYLKTNAKNYRGMLTGWFFILMPTMRFGVEFIKNSQGGIENNFGNVLSTGQLLSIPFIIAGILLVIFSIKRK